MVWMKIPVPQGVFCLKNGFSDLLAVETENPDFYIKTRFFTTAGYGKSVKVRTFPDFTGLVRTGLDQSGLYWILPDFALNPGRFTAASIISPGHESESDNSPKKILLISLLIFLGSVDF